MFVGRHPRRPATRTIITKQSLYMSSHRRVRSSVLYRIVAASGSLPQQNFDYANRFAVLSAQDDIQDFYCASVEKNGRFVNRPYGED